MDAPIIGRLFREGASSVFSKVVATQLHTVRDYIRYALSRFNEAQLFYGHGTDNAWDEAVHLVLHTLHLPWNTDASLLDARLTEAEKLAVLENLRLRVEQRLPAPYIMGEAWFMGLPFHVDQRVLIPRSPIAELLENECQPWLGVERVQRVLDLCCGSGCIGIGAALVFPEAHVDLVDISEDALRVARKNIGRHQVEDRVTAIQSDLFENLSVRYDLILSNPPYVDAMDMASLPMEFRHEPRLGLEAGDDGLDLVRIILAQAGDYLTEQGCLVVEVGNSAAALEEAYPEVAFTWLEFEHGGDGIFLMTQEELTRHGALFQKRVKAARV